jgi:hypothetical protein
MKREDNHKGCENKYFNVEKINFRFQGSLLVKS